MLNQELLSAIFGSAVPPLSSHLTFLAVATLAAVKDPKHESLWEAANRICDRYLPQIEQG
jgi:hypothetical protein